MKVYANEPIVALLGEPRLESERSDEVLFGWSMEVLEDLGEFYKVRAFYRYEGYVEKKRVTERRESDHQLKMIKNAFSDLMREPVIQSHVALTLPRGSVLRSCGTKENQFVKVYDHDLKAYWVHANQLVDVPKKNFDRRAIVDTALSFMDVSYRWGGKTHAGLDCSGLMFISYLLNGLQIYRDANIVEGFGILEIPREEAQPADLIFFPGHVAMLIDKDLYVHSNLRDGKVSINSLDPDHELYLEGLANSITAFGAYHE